MRAIIIQKPFPPRLPELRNLGTVLRILLAVNGLALVVAFDREARWEAFSASWFDTTAIVEPHLLASLLLLYTLAPWLERMPYRTGVIAILALNLVIDFHQFTIEDAADNFIGLHPLRAIGFRLGSHIRERMVD